MLGREDRQEKDAETEGPGEERADGDVVCPRLVSEQAHRDAAENRRGVEADQDVEAEDGCGQRAGEGDVAQRVAGEDLGAENDEVPDQAAGESDETARDQRIAHELVREHQAPSSASGAAARLANPRPTRTST